MMGFSSNGFYYYWLVLLSSLALMVPFQEILVSAQDTDLCQKFKADCNSCLASKDNCYWCPGDATCYNSPLYTFSSVLTSCTESSDYTQTTCTENENYFSDPLYDGQQWVLDMVNVVQVWDLGYFGAGVRVRINDSGVDASHAEFQGRFDRDGSCDIVEPPSEQDPSGAFHGTAVASIVGAAGDNNECAVGIAPQVTLSACYAFATNEIFAEKLDSFDISQNSWGIDACAISSSRTRLQQACPFTYSEETSAFPCDVCGDNFSSNDISSDCENSIINHCRRYYEQDVEGCLDFLDLILGGNCYFGVLSDGIRQDMERGILEGREGKGVIYVFASGNAFQTGDDTNFQALTNTRFGISVGAVGKDASHASYSTPGASLFISAPGGDFENISNLMTANLGGGCIEAGEGTSWACPVVSGAIALMLEANPNLTWRDVQSILAITSQPVDDDPDDNTATTNGVGIWHSHLYGFGIVDAGAAVLRAKNWELVGSEKQWVGISEVVDLALPEGTPVSSSISVAAADDSSNNMYAESVAVYLDITNISRGHLETTLTSPQGTRSILTPGKRPENTQLTKDDRWKLLSVKNWGESPIGDWTLTIVDNKPGDVEGCVSGGWFFEDGAFSCADMERVDYCKNGDLDPLGLLDDEGFDFLFSYESDGRTAEEACCACGGGMDPKEVVDQLTQWRIVVYGRNFDAGGALKEDTDDPTPTPTLHDTLAPTPNPTIRETIAPTPKPTLSDTLAPSPNPTIRETTVTTTIPAAVAPTLFPTTMEVVDETNSPSTEAPTNMPSTMPSEAPSMPPVQEGSAAPSLSQSITATTGVTGNGTNAPSGQNATVTPTQAPTTSSDPLTSQPADATSPTPDASGANDDGALSLAIILLMGTTAVLVVQILVG